MEVYSSQFQKVSYDEQNFVIKQEYLPDSKKYDKNSYKEDHLGVNDAVQKKLNGKKTKRLFADMRNMNYTIAPDLQEWHNTYIFPVVEESGVEKIAILVSSHLFTEVSVQQTLEVGSKRSIKWKDFNNEEEAWKWLLE